MKLQLLIWSALMLMQAAVLPSDKEASAQGREPFINFLVSCQLGTMQISAYEFNSKLRLVDSVDEVIRKDENGVSSCTSLPVLKKWLQARSAPLHVSITDAHAYYTTDGILRLKNSLLELFESLQLSSGRIASVELHLQSDVDIRHRVECQSGLVKVCPQECDNNEERYYLCFETKLNPAGLIAYSRVWDRKTNKMVGIEVYTPLPQTSTTEAQTVHALGSIKEIERLCARYKITQPISFACDMSGSSQEAYSSWTEWQRRPEGQFMMDYFFKLLHEQGITRVTGRLQGKACDLLCRGKREKSETHTKG
jgi:hypothetical protein